MKSHETSSANAAIAIARKLKLVPIPTEGGYYVETFRSKETLPRPGQLLGRDGRAAMTAIYFLLFRDFNTMHKMGAHEVWTHHSGSTLTLYQLREDGSLIAHKLGNVLEADENRPQVVIEANCWMAAELERPDDYALVSCMVIPGFEPNDCQFANRKEMCARYPQHRELFMRLVRVMPDSDVTAMSYMSPPLV